MSNRPPIAVVGILGLFSLMPHPVAFSQGKPVPLPPAPPVIPVNAERVFFRTLPSDGTGFYVVWNTGNTTDGATLMAQRYSLDDKPAYPAAGLVLARNLSEPGLWDSCMDGQGGLITAAGEKDRVVIRRTDPTGSVLWEQTVTTYGSALPVTSIVIVPDGHGGVFLTWAQGTPENSVVSVQLWDAAGKPQWQPPGLAVAPADARQIGPNILPDGQGGAVVAWNSFQNESHIRAQRFDINGKRLWNDTGMGVVRPAGDLNQRITMVAPGSGSLVVAWTQGVQGINRIFYQRIEPGGHRSWSGGGITGRPPILEQWSPLLLADGKGGVWIGSVEVDTGGTAKVKVVRRGPPNGEAWPPGEVGLANTDGDQGRLALALDGQDGVLAAWIENRADVGIYVQDVNNQGVARYPRGLKIAADDHHPQIPHIVLAAPARLAVVWVDEKGKGLWDLQHRLVDLRP
jgi:hypothetical protein